MQFGLFWWSKFFHLTIFIPVSQLINAYM